MKKNIFFLFRNRITFFDLIFQTHFFFKRKKNAFLSKFIFVLRNRYDIKNESMLNGSFTDNAL